MKKRVHVTQDAMLSEDYFRQMNEERFLVYQVLNAMTTKDMANWSVQPRIGDIYAQKEKPRLTNFETIRNPDVPANASGQHAGFFQSKYFKKRVKQLRSYIEKIRPFDVYFQSPNGEVPEEIIEETIATTSQSELECVVKASLDPNGLFVKTAPGVTQSQSVICRNESTTAIYYQWEIASDVDLMIGGGADRISVRKCPDGTDFSERFDWSVSEAFNLPGNQQPKTRAEFCFTQMSGSITPGWAISFGFSFKSDVAGDSCFAFISDTERLQVLQMIRDKGQLYSQFCSNER
jgi:hypothetical protein